MIAMAENDFNNLLLKYNEGSEYPGEVETPDWYNKAMSVIGGAIAEPFTERPRDRLKSRMDEGTIAQLDQAGVELPKMASDIINTEQGPIPVDMEGNPLDWERMSATKYLINQLGNVMGGVVAPVKGIALGSGPILRRQAVQAARELSPLGFYSHGADTAANLAQAKGTPEQFRSMLEKAGVKPVEMEGFDEAFASRPSVTREELAQHFNERRPQVEETVLGFNQNEVKAARERAESAGNNWDELGPVNQGRYIRSVSGRSLTDYGTDPKFSQYTLPGGENYREVLLKLPESSEYVVRNKSDQILSRHPDRASALAEMQKQKVNDPYVNIDKASDIEGFKSSHWNDPNVLAHLRMADRTGPNGEKILHVEEIQSDWGQKGKKEGFAPNADKTEKYTYRHDPEDDVWEILNPQGELVEVSLSEREARDAARQFGQGANIAVPNGGKPPSAPYVTNTQAWTDLALKRALKEAAEGGYDKLVWTPGAEQAKRYDLSKQISRLVLENDPAGGHKLRAYSHSGDQVINKRIVDADRELPDLIGKDVAKKLLDQDLVNPKVFNEKLTSNDIIVVPKENRYQISAPWGWSTHVGMGVVDSPEAAAEYGARHFSNLAKEANSNMGTSHATEYKNATRSLIGQDLSVGGEGMKGYYDKIVPNQLSKLVKKLDPEAKIGTHEIRTTKESDLRRKLRDAGYDPDQVDLQEILADSGGSTPRGFTETDLDAIEMGKHLEGTSLKSISAPSLTITPKMREAIMKGQTEFARGGSVKGYALGGQADIAQANIDLLNEMARRYNLTAGDGSVAADAQSQAEADRYAEMAAAINAGVERGDNSLFGNANQQTPTSTNFTTNTPATVAYDPRANDMVPYSNTNYMPNAVQSYNLSNLSPSQQAAVITSSQTNPTSTQTAAITPTTNTNVAALPSTIEGFAPSSKGVGNLVSPGFTASDKIASRAGEALPGYLGPLQQAFFDESKALMGAYGTLPSSVTNVAIQPEQLADWLAVQQEMFGDERAAAINQGIINGDLSLFGEGQTPNVGAPQENFNGSVAGTNIAGTFDPLASPDVLGDISYGTFGLSGPMGLSNAIQEMQDQQEDSGPEDGGDSGPEDGGDGDSSGSESDSSGSESDSSGSDDNGGADGDYALGGTVNKDLMKLYRKYSKKSRKYAQGGPVAVYDPAEIDAIAARIREGNYA